ncbi:MAG: NADH-quinone oxidoreductase subunit J [Candidatus Hermodarchaeota archaeon]
MQALSLELFLFLGISTLTVFFAGLIIWEKNQVRAIIFLTFFLITIAGMYLLLGAQYLAIVQIMVYAGGVVVLFIFAIHLTRSEEFRVRGSINQLRSLPIFAGLLLVLVVALSALIGTEPSPNATLDVPVSELGYLLFGQQLVSFFFMGLILFATIFATIYLVSWLIEHPVAYEMGEEEIEELLNENNGGLE